MIYGLQPYFAAGTTETIRLSSLLVVKITVPSTKAKMVWSLPIPTPLPGWNDVPLWRRIMLPAFAGCPPNILTPSLLLCDSLPFFELPTPFLCAMTLRYLKFNYCLLLFSALFCRSFFCLWFSFLFRSCLFLWRCFCFLHFCYRGFYLSFNFFSFFKGCCFFKSFTFS